MAGRHFLILSTQGGLRAADGSPIALGYHTGHWEVGLLVEAAAARVAAEGGLPFAGYCTDPCDGRTQGTAGMFDSLPYRNDAAIVFRRLIRSLPNCRGVLGVATCDKGLPAMMMALAGAGRLPSVLVPGGVMLPAQEAEDTAKVQTLGARFAARRDQPGGRRSHGLPRLRLARRRLPVPGHGGHRAGGRRGAWAWRCRTRRWPLRRSRSGCDMARRSARALLALAARRGDDRAHILTPDSIHNAMVRPRGVWRLDEPAAAPAGHRPRRRTAPPHGRRLGRVNRARAPAGRRAAQRAGQSPHGPRVSGGRRARSDAAPARTGPAAARRADRQRPHAGRGPPRGGSSPSAAAACGRNCGNCDGVDPEEVIMSPQRARQRRTYRAPSPSRAATWRPRARWSRAPPSTRAWWTQTACSGKKARRGCSAREAAAIAAVKSPARTASGPAT